MSARICLIEDDEPLAELISAYLGKHQYEVFSHERGDTAPQFIQNTQPDLVILDVMLPGLDGFEICKQIRHFFHGGILIMTARDEPFDEILGLELGADDYLTKPVDPRLLLARIRANLRMRQQASVADPSIQATLQFGNLMISSQTRVATLDDIPLDLTTAEFDLLWLLASHAGEVLSRDDMMNALRGVGFDGIDRSIDARISRLRKRLNDDSDNPTRIKTVRGKGYLFSKPDLE